MSNFSLKKHLTRSLLILIFILGNHSNIIAATVTVKQLGGGDYSTIGQAIFFSNPEDEIVVYPGRYEEAVVLDKNLTLIGKGPQTTSIYSPTDGITVQTNVKTKIMGFTITSGSVGIYLDTDADAVIKNNCIVGNGAEGVLVYSRYASTKATLINNVIAFNNDAGVYSRNAYGDQEVSVVNNIICNNGDGGINFYKGDNSILFNNVYLNTSGNYLSEASAGTGDISMDPLFIDSGSGNFVLQSNSPCRNFGRPGTSDLDPDGSRNDMGAYGGPDSAAFWPYPLGAPVITEINATPTSVVKGETITIEAVGEILE